MARPHDSRGSSMLRQLEPGVFELVRIEAPVISSGARDWMNVAPAAASDRKEQRIEQRIDAVGPGFKHALQRLARDWQECQRNPLPSVAAQPVSDQDLLEWHGNIRGAEGTDYADVVLHFVLIFPPNFPTEAPICRLKTPIPHPNVFGEKICLNMFDDFTPYWDDVGTKELRYGGWTSAYSVQSILLQLQSFLFDGAWSKDHWYPHGVDRRIAFAKSYHCGKCGHRGQGPFVPNFVSKISAVAPCSLPSVPARARTQNCTVQAPAVAPAPQKPAVKIESKQREYKEPESRPVKRNPLPHATRNGNERLVSTRTVPRLLVKDPSVLVGRTLEGLVTSVVTYGLFVDIGWYKDVLVHMSELNFPHNVPVDPATIYKKGQCVSVKIIKYAPEGRRLAASLKLEAARNRETSGVYCFPLGPFNGHLGARHPLAGRNTIEDLEVGAEYPGIVRALATYGAFVDLVPSVGKHALLPLTSLRNSLAPVRHVWETADILQRDAKIMVRVESVDVERGRITVSYSSSNNPALANAVVHDAEGYEAEEELEEGSNPLIEDHRKKSLERQRAIRHSRLRDCPDDLIIHIFGYLNPSDLRRIRSCCKLFNVLVDDAVSVHVIKQELLCYHTKRTFQEGTLGFGLNISYYPGSAEISAITPSLDLLSGSAFYEQQVRMGVWKETFTHWIPVYINNDHGKLALNHAESAIAAICKPKGRLASEFHPNMVLKVLPTLMNTMVVSVMNGDVYASIRALDGYCAFYHLFLAFCERYPELQTEAEKRVEMFLKNEWGRNKYNCPSLGEFIALLAICDDSNWKKIAVTYLQECFDRNVKWVVAKYPELVTVDSFEVQSKPQIVQRDRNVLSIMTKYGILTESDAKSEEMKEKEHAAEIQSSYANADAGRLRKTFEATAVSNRLLMFHVHFFQMFRSQRLHDGREMQISTRDVKLRLDRSYGRATYAMQEALQEEVKRIRNIRRWTDFFEKIGLPMPRYSYLLNWLRQACINSARRRYHRPQDVLSKRREQDKRRQAQQRKKKPALNFDDDFDYDHLDDDFGSQASEHFNSAEYESDDEYHDDQ